MVEVFVGNLVLTDSDSEIGPAVIVVQNGRIAEVHKGTADVNVVKGRINKVKVWFQFCLSLAKCSQKFNEGSSRPTCHARRQILHI